MYITCSSDNCRLLFSQSQLEWTELLPFIAQFLSTHHTQVVSQQKISPLWVSYLLYPASSIHITLVPASLRPLLGGAYSPGRAFLGVLNGWFVPKVMTKIYRVKGNSSGCCKKINVKSLRTREESFMSALMPLWENTIGTFIRYKIQQALCAALQNKSLKVHNQLRIFAISLLLQVDLEPRLKSILFWK